MKRIFTILACVSAACVAEAKLNIIATTPDYGSIAQAIGGENIELTTLAKPTEDPHFVDAKPSFIVKLNRADAIIEGGAELESGWLPPLIEQSRNHKLASGAPGHILGHEGVSLLEVPETLDRSKGDIHAAGNPHFTTDPANARIVAEHVAKAFCQLDSKSCNAYETNLKKFESALDAKIAEWQKLLAPYKGRRLVTYHNSWIYFVKRFDLQADIFLEPKPGIPPTPSHLAQVIVKMKSENARVILVQPYQNRKTAETVAGHANAVVVDFPTFPGGKGAESYIDWMDSLVKSLVKAFEQTK